MKKIAILVSFLMVSEFSFAETCPFPDLIKADIHASVIKHDSISFRRVGENNIKDNLNTPSISFKHASYFRGHLRCNYQAITNSGKNAWLSFELINKNIKLTGRQWASELVDNPPQERDSEGSYSSQYRCGGPDLPSVSVGDCSFTVIDTLYDLREI